MTVSITRGNSKSSISPRRALGSVEVYSSSDSFGRSIATVIWSLSIPDCFWMRSLYSYVLSAVDRMASLLSLNDIGIVVVLPGSTTINPPSSVKWLAPSFLSKVMLAESVSV